MNRTYFWILTFLSCLIAVLLVTQIILGRITANDRILLAKRQELINTGQTCDRQAREVATRIYQLAQQTQDQGLKDIMTRQQIVVSPASTNAAPAATPAPASH